MSDNALIAVPEDLKFVARLPNELKAIILEHYFQLPRVITRKTHSSLFPLRVLTFALNKSFADLAKRLYYSSNIFRLTLEDLSNGWRPSPELSQMIQHLEISMYIMKPDHNLAVGWWTPDKPDLEILESIPKFPNLKTLALALHYQATNGSVHSEMIEDFICRHQGLAFHRYSVLLSAIVEVIRPGEVEIIFSGKDCPWLQKKHAGKECGCRRTFEKSLGAYVKGNIAP